jgi:hypothetical protein
MPMQSAKMTEDQMVNLVRNALLVAGMEMGGPQGDHWPVIKSTIHSVMKDWEDLKTERRVHDEAHIHYQQMIRDLEKLSAQASGSVKADIDDTIMKIRQLVEACFAKVDNQNAFNNDNDVPLHAKRAEVIIKTLGGDDE